MLDWQVRVQGLISTDVTPWTGLDYTAVAVDRRQWTGLMVLTGVEAVQRRTLRQQPVPMGSHRNCTVFVFSQ